MLNWGKFEIWNLEYGIWNLGFGIWDLEFGIWDLEFGIWNLGFGIWRGGHWVVATVVLVLVRVGARHVVPVFGCMGVGRFGMKSGCFLKKFFWAGRGRWMWGVGGSLGVRRVYVLV